MERRGVLKGTLREILTHFRIYASRAGDRENYDLFGYVRIGEACIHSCIVYLCIVITALAAILFFSLQIFNLSVFSDFPMFFVKSEFERFTTLDIPYIPKSMCYIACLAFY